MNRVEKISVIMEMIHSYRQSVLLKIPELLSAAKTIEHVHNSNVIVEIMYLPHILYLYYVEDEAVYIFHANVEACTDYHHSTAAVLHILSDSSSCVLV